LSARTFPIGIIMMPILLFILPASAAEDAWPPIDYGDTAAACVVLNEIMPEPWDASGGEWIELFNPANTTADMGGWVLDDIPSGGSRPFIIPKGTNITARGFLLFNNATTGIGLNNDIDSVRLLDPDGIFRDEYSYNSTSRGESLGRAPDGGKWTRLAVPTPGQSNGEARTQLGYETFDVGELRTFVSPDCSYSVITGELELARRSILLSLYQLENLYLVKRMVGAVKRGVDVDVLLEGCPVGGITYQEREAARLLVEGGASVSFFGTPNDSRSNDRYVFVHAKYCIIDGTTCIVDSENWKMTGIPVNSTYGNSGWGVVIRSKALAAYLAEVFRRDSEPGARDVHPYSATDPYFGPPPWWFSANYSVPVGEHVPMIRPALFSAGRVSPVLSPDTSVLGNGSILGLIDGAARTLLVEQFQCMPDWDSKDGPCANLYLEAVIRAARRGVDVKVLLDGTYLAEDDWSSDNRDAFNLLRYLSCREGLKLEVRFAAMTGIAKMHNKGLVVDGEKALVSSINWGRTSVMENREVGLIIESAGAAHYFEQAFLHDWSQSAQAHVTSLSVNDTVSARQTAFPALCGILPVVMFIAVFVVAFLRYRKKPPEFSSAPRFLESIRGETTAFGRWPFIRRPSRDGKGPSGQATGPVSGAPPSGDPAASGPWRGPS